METRINFLGIMPKTNYLTTPVKESIVKAKEQGNSVRKIALLFSVSQGTVSKLCKKQRTEGFT